MSGWPTVTHMFGNKELTSKQESITIKDENGYNQMDIKELEICIDNRYINILQAGFEGFRFTLSDDT